MSPADAMRALLAVRTDELSYEGRIAYIDSCRRVMRRALDEIPAAAKPATLSADHTARLKEAMRAVESCGWDAQKAAGHTGLTYHGIRRLLQNAPFKWREQYQREMRKARAARARQGASDKAAREFFGALAE